jgi:hypothetical protein
MRQAPMDLRESVEQSFGILIPAVAAARMIEVPAGASVRIPSMMQVTNPSTSAGGVP